MAAAANWYFDTGAQEHNANVLECPPAELAGEIAGNCVAVFTHCVPFFDSEASISYPSGFVRKITHAAP